MCISFPKPFFLVRSVVIGSHAYIYLSRLDTDCNCIIIIIIFFFFFFGGVSQVVI